MFRGVHGRVAGCSGLLWVALPASLTPAVPCHDVRGVVVKLALDPNRNAVNIEATATTVGPTGA